MTQYTCLFFFFIPSLKYTGQQYIYLWKSNYTVNKMDRGQLFSCLSLTELIFCCLIKAQLLCEMFFRMHFSTGNTSFSSQVFWKMFVLNCKERKKRRKKEPRVQTRDMPPIVRIIMTILLLILKGNFFFFFLNSVCQRRTGLLNPVELLLKDCVFWIQANFIRQWLRISD